jgi:hypothetical protein
LAAPLITVFLTEFIPEKMLNMNNIYEISNEAIDTLEEKDVSCAEADVFWCLSKVVDDVQDNYTEL